MKTVYGLCTYFDSKGQYHSGIVIGENLWSLETLIAAQPGSELVGQDTTISALLERWDTALPALDQLAAVAATGKIPAQDINACDLHAPSKPRQIFCTGANYRKHVIDLTVDMGVGPEGLDRAGLRQWAAEMMDKRVREGEPYAFTKPVSTVAGPNDALVIPTTTQQTDWEIELGVIIGRGGYNIPLDEAMEHVAGYAIVNDISARDLIARTDYKMLGTDWLRAKGQPGFLPYGPMIIPAAFVENPYALSLRLSVNGQMMQDESSSDMLFNIAQQIAYISRYAKLLPGDLICTGSPAGNGTHYGRFLQPGDIMIGEITGLGRQRIACIAP